MNSVYQKLYLYFRKEIDNPNIKKLENIISYYHKNFEKNKKEIKNKEYKYKINSSEINQFFKNHNTLFSDYYHHQDLEPKDYTFNEAIKKVRELSLPFTANKNDNTNVRIITEAISLNTVLIFLDYLCKNNKKFSKPVQLYYMSVMNGLDERINQVSVKLKVLNLYKNKKLTEDILKQHINQLNFHTSIDDDYTCLCANLLCMLLYKDENQSEKLKYLIDFVSNNSVVYFHDFDVITLFKSFSNNHCKTKKSKHNPRVKRGALLFKISFSVLLFASLAMINKTGGHNEYVVYSVCNDEIFTYETASHCLDEIFSSGNITNLKELNEIAQKIESIPNNKLLQLKLELKYREYNDIENLNDKISNLFVDDNLSVVKDSVSLKQRYEIYDLLTSAYDSTFLEQNLKYLDMVDLKLNSKEVVELVEVPFVSQKEAKIFNGCEAASLLMALQYKDKLQGISLDAFVKIMPTHESDPHKGFIHSFYTYEPTDVVHWIAPDALAKFASKYTKSIDISGTEASNLKQYIDKNNPVIVYVTADFKDYKEFDGEVPINLHVVLLTGYNKSTGNYIIIDPYRGRQEIEKDLFETIYNRLKFAVTFG